MNEASAPTLELPDDTVKPREREVWLKEDQKILNRAMRLFVSRDIAVTLYCTLHTGPNLTREATAGGFELLCDCKRRVFNRIPEAR